MDKDKRIYSLISIAMKSGGLKSGEFAVTDAVKKSISALVIVADDASDNTKKSYDDMCSFYKCPIRYFGNRISLGECIGKELRAAVSILDEGLAAKIIDLIDEL